LEKGRGKAAGWIDGKRRRLDLNSQLSNLKSFFLPQADQLS
jgi:hypothetical protein